MKKLKQRILAAGLLLLPLFSQKTLMCVEPALSTLIKTTRLAAGRWFVAAGLLAAAGMHAAEPTFVDVTATVAPGLPQTGFSAVGWTDYDNDGRLDFLLTGLYWTHIPPSTYATYISQVWRNTGSAFTNMPGIVASDLQGVNDGSKAWGDYDNDGHLDFLTAGGAIWRNTESGFTNVTASVAPGLPEIHLGAAGWGDYDNDGRLDFLVTGGIPRRTDLDDDLPYTAISQLWRNTGSGFVNVTPIVSPSLPGSFYGSVAWADYDNDGRLDFLLSGQLFRNTGSGFVNVTAAVAPGMPGNAYSSAAWGDYDNDGRLDILLSGQVWRNTVTGFTNVTASVAPGLQRVWHASVAWGDYDNDGRLDFLHTGAKRFNCDGCDLPDLISQLWRNNGPQTNAPPAVITGLPGDASPTSAVLQARIHPHGQAVNGWFMWGMSTNYGQVTAPQQIGNSNAFVSFAQPITGLSTGVTYYYRAVGSNDQGQVVLGVEQRFLLAPPVVTGSSVAELTPTSATLNGHLNPNNLPTYGWLEWGPTAALGQTTPVRFLANGFDATVGQSLPGLGAGTTYYFRAVVSNSLGVVYGPMQSISTPTFANVTAAVAPGLPQLGNGSVAWADYDNDGQLDFLLTGYFNDAEAGDDLFFCQFWRNTGSGFTGTGAAPGLEGVWADSMAWGDYDNDGRLDFLITGARDIDGRYEMSQVWRNTGSGFTNVTATVAPGLPQVGHSSVAWSDYDNDGRLDFLLTGSFYYEGDETSGDVFVSQLWRNTGSGFTNVTAAVAPGLPQVGFGSVAWGDYDNDGRLDFLLTGAGATNYHSVSQLWRNTGNGFTNVTATVAPGLPQVWLSSVAWGDYDNDGWLDFLLTGETLNSDDAVSQVWRNTGKGFTNVTATVAPGLPGVGSGSIAWGDYDNDGRLDFLLTGFFYNDNYNRVSQVWRNTENGFANVTATVARDLPGVGSGSIAWGDYDSDGRLDFLLTGYGYSNDHFISQLWRNYTPVINTPPSAPTGLAMTATTNAVMLSWNSATDGQTPASGLTYNVRAGTTPGGNDLLSAHVNATNGFRRVPTLGNAMLRHSLPLTGLTNLTNGQTVYWSVQAVDTSFAGGPFATETSGVSLPVLSVSLNSQPSTINVSWTPPTFGWVLQQSTSLNANNWVTMTGDRANPVTLSATNGAQLYRLFKP